MHICAHVHALVGALVHAHSAGSAGLVGPSNGITSTGTAYAQHLSSLTHSVPALSPGPSPRRADTHRLRSPVASALHAHRTWSTQDDITEGLASVPELEQSQSGLSTSSDTSPLKSRQLSTQVSGYSSPLAPRRLLHQHSPRWSTQQPSPRGAIQQPSTRGSNQSQAQQSQRKRTLPGRQDTPRGAIQQPPTRGSNQSQAQQSQRKRTLPGQQDTRWVPELDLRTLKTLAYTEDTGVHVKSVSKAQTSILADFQKTSPRQEFTQDKKSSSQASSDLEQEDVPHYWM